MGRQNTTVPEQYKNKPIYSFSRLSSYNNCPYEYYQTYILNKSRKTNIYGLLGGYVHSLIEQLQRQEISNKEAMEMFRNKVLECDILEVTFPSDTIKTNFVECIEHYLMNYEPIECKYFNIEMEFYTTVGDTSTCILGYIDIVFLKEDGTLHIHDYKTSTMYDKQTLKEHSRQLILYALALQNEYHTLPDTVAFNMLKYVIIFYNNGKKIKKIKCQRNKIIKTLYPYLLEELYAVGMIDFEIEILLNKCTESNTIDTLPQEVQNKFTFTDCLIECPINEETIKDLKDFIDTTVTKIEDKKNLNTEWGTLNILKNSFYCGTLCNQRGNCKFYHEYIEGLSLGRKESDLLDNIFG